MIDELHEFHVVEVLVIDVVLVKYGCCRNVDSRRSASEVKG